MSTERSSGGSGDMSEKRDPRVDPKPGDVLRKGKRTRTITHVTGPSNNRLEGPWVAFQTPTDAKHGNLQCERPDIFNGWAKKAEVIHAAE